MNNHHFYKGDAVYFDDSGKMRHATRDKGIDAIIINGKGDFVLAKDWIIDSSSLTFRVLEAPQKSPWDSETLEQLLDKRSDAT